MKCPYCAEDIKDEAFVCKHCGRDLSVTKAVYEQLRLAFAQIAELRSDIERLAAMGPADRSSRPQPQGLSPGTIRSFAYSFFTPFALLVLAYFVIVMGFDTRPWILRLALIAISIAFGFADIGGVRRSWPYNVALAISLGAASILTMDWVDAVVRQAPFSLTKAELLEELSYVISIALSYITGVLAARLAGPERARLDAPSLRVATSIAARFGSGGSRVENFQKHAQLVQTVLNTGMLLGTAATAVFTGLHNLFA